MSVQTGGARCERLEVKKDEGLASGASTSGQSRLIRRRIATHDQRMTPLSITDLRLTINIIPFPVRHPDIFHSGPLAIAPRRTRRPKRIHDGEFPVPFDLVVAHTIATIARRCIFRHRRPVFLCTRTLVLDRNSLRRRARARARRPPHAPRRPHRLSDDGRPWLRRHPGFPPPIRTYARRRDGILEPARRRGGTLGRGAPREGYAVRDDHGLERGGQGGAGVGVRGRRVRLGVADLQLSAGHGAAGGAGAGKRDGTQRGPG